MLPLRENTWVIGNLVTVTIIATVMLGTIVIVIATTAIGITVGVTGTVILMAGTTEIGATGTAEAHLAGIHLIIVVAEATLVALQEPVVVARLATATLKEARRTALGRTPVVGRRYSFV